MSTSWQDLVIAELHRNSDKIDTLSSKFSTKIDELEEKFYESAEQHREFMKEQAKLREEHTRMNDLLDIHIEGVKTNKGRLDRFELRTEPILNELAPIIEDFKGQKYLKQYRSSNYKDLTIKLSIFSLFISIVSGTLKFFGVF